jgi:hypothetical protein
MIKKIATVASALALAFMVSSPAYADHGRRNNDAAVLIGGIIIGAAINEALDDDRGHRGGRDACRRGCGGYDYPDTRYEDRRYRGVYRDMPYRVKCYTVYTTEFDRYGRPYRLAEHVCR